METNSRFQNSYILQAWLVLTLSLTFGCSLAGVQVFLGPKIEQNKINEIKERVPEVILGKDEVQKMTANDQMLAITPQKIKIDKGGRTTAYSVFQTSYPDGTPAGWVVRSAGQGYADTIELLFGLGPKADQLTGVYILNQKETPGLGNKIIEDAWRQQFTDKPIKNKLVAVKTAAVKPNEIDAVTGATISSQSVCTIINRAANDLKDRLQVKDAPQRERK